MSQRESGYERKERDLYETPEWVTEALFPHLPTLGAIWEPACGSGKMQRTLERTGAYVLGSDLHNGPDHDFLLLRLPEGSAWNAIITNPPYELAQKFIEHAVRLMEPEGQLVAMLLRTDFDHAKSRSHLFRDCPVFSKKLVLTKRIVWFEAEEGKPKAAPSFNHAWYIWDLHHEGPPTIAYGP